jgi:F-type H+-transporting ATPase subunit epsilon
MAAVFSLSMYTPEETLFTGDVVSVIVPSVDGSMGVLAHHTPIVALLAGGPITIKDARGQTKVFQARGTGCFEVAHNAATILLENVEAV